MKSNPGKIIRYGQKIISEMKAVPDSPGAFDKLTKILNLDQIENKKKKYLHDKLLTALSNKKIEIFCEPSKFSPEWLKIPVTGILIRVSSN